MQVLKKIQNAREMLIVAGMVAMSGAASASTGGGSGTMPWESALGTIQQSLQGPIAKMVIVLGVVVSGIVFIISGAAEGAKKLAALIFGASIILGGVSMISSMFGGLI